jgi:hypothetical protein
MENKHVLISSFLRELQRLNSLQKEKVADYEERLAEKLFGVNNRK